MFHVQLLAFLGLVTTCSRSKRLSLVVVRSIGRGSGSDGSSSRSSSSSSSSRPQAMSSASQGLNHMSNPSDFNLAQAIDHAISWGS